MVLPMHIPFVHRCFQKRPISHMYGGIHYQAAIEMGLQQGFKVGALVNEKLQMRYNSP